MSWWFFRKETRSRKDVFEALKKDLAALENAVAL